MVLERIGRRVPYYALDDGVWVNWRFADEIPCPDLGRVEDDFGDGFCCGHFGRLPWGSRLRWLVCGIELVIALLASLGSFGWWELVVE